jgi:NADH-quinone oxidoreductase subunit J
MMTYYIILLVLMIAVALWTVMTSSLLKSAIGLAVTSAILAVIMYQLLAPWAAVLELSVCAGLITVVFVSAISLTAPATLEEERELARKKLLRFAPLPVLVIGAGLVLWLWLGKFGAPPLALGGEAAGTDVRDVLWNTRQLDIAGQILIILTGIFGVVVLFKKLAERKGSV